MQIKRNMPQKASCYSKSCRKCRKIFTPGTEIDVLNKLVLITKSALLLALLTGCSTSAITPGVREDHAPANWTSEIRQDPVSEAWLEDFNNEKLERMVSAAMQSNFQLAQQQQRIEQARQSVIVSGASRYPEFTLTASGSRQRQVFAERLIGPNNNFQISGELSFEIDLWGRLADTQKQASLTLAAEEAGYRQARNSLAAEVSRAWFNVISAEQLLKLFRERLANLDVDMDIIERAYRQGLNTALDVYLTRSTVEQERSRIAQQEQRLRENRTALQVLMAVYPDGNVESDEGLPLLEDQIPAGLPSELLSRRPDLQQAWWSLLAADVGLAIAHKQRFPRISLAASASDASNELGQLLDGSAPAWSLLGNLAQPLFNAGRLKAEEERARSQVVQAEKRYLELLYQAFAEVENTISRQAALQDQYDATLEADRHSSAAFELAFEQYQRGLVSYTTVLESQRRAFDAQSAVIDLRNQLLQNRINLYLALGGNFELENS